MEAPLIQLKNVAFKPQEELVLDDIQLSIPKGKKIRVTGASGSGKSTLLKLIAFLIPKDSGTIQYQGRDIKEISPMEYRKKVSYITQTPQLFGKTIEDNLRFPAEVRNESFDSERAKQLLKDFHLEYLELNQPVKNLSGGERQRVGLIRHFMYEPEVLLLDEISSALDEDLRESVWKWLVNHAKEHQQTIMWISHIEDELIQPDAEIHLEHHTAEWREL